MARDAESERRGRRNSGNEMSCLVRYKTKLPFEDFGSQYATNSSLKKKKKGGPLRLQWLRKREGVGGTKGPFPQINEKRFMNAAFLLEISEHYV